MRDRLVNVPPHDVLKMSDRVDAFLTEYKKTSFPGRVKTKEVQFYELAKEIFETYFRNHSGMVAAYFRKKNAKGPRPGKHLHHVSLP